MFYIVLLIGVYVLGVFACRKSIMDAVKWYDGFDVIICFIPIAHWAMALIMYVSTDNFDEKVIGRFFKKRD